MERIKEIKSVFEKQFIGAPDAIVRAPGRINLIGEHTDYNQGFVLPAAIDRDILFAVSARDDRKAALYSANFGETEEFLLDEPLEKKKKWSDYPKGVIKMLLNRNFRLKGVRAAIEGNVPIGSGLSSSAAMEVGMAVALAKINSLDIDAQEIIRLSQKAENEFVGVSCGIMDQFVSCLGKKGFALFIDCRSLDYDYIPLALGDSRIAICNTKVKRELAGSAYNQRRAECSQGVELLKKNVPGIKSLRDVSTQIFGRYKGTLPPVIAKRCEHVVMENKRVLDSVDLLRAGNLKKFGELLYASHESLKSLYEVSCAELDLMVEIASGTRGVLGCRMTGAGFGGCAIAFVKESAVQSFTGELERRYFEHTGSKPEVYICETQNGASAGLK